MPQKRRKLQSSTPETKAKRAETQRAVDAIDAMQAARPLKGPPLRTDTQMRTAGAIALASDKKHGAYDELRPIDFALEHPYRGGHDGSSMPALKVVT